MYILDKPLIGMGRDIARVSHPPRAFTEITKLNMRLWDKNSKFHFKRQKLDAQNSYRIVGTGFQKLSSIAKRFQCQIKDPDTF